MRVKKQGFHKKIGKIKGQLQPLQPLRRRFENLTENKMLFTHVYRYHTYQNVTASLIRAD